MRKWHHTLPWSENSAMGNGEEILKKVQAKIAEQNQVILEFTQQNEELKARIQELEARVEELSSVENERNDILSELSKLVD